MKKQLIEKIKNIKMLAMDVDGVLTGGEIIYINDTDEIKIWSVKDRMGFALAHRAPDIKLAWITGRSSREVERCARECQIDFLYQNATTKIDAYKELKEKFSLSDEQIAYIGDDLIDIPILRRAGLAVSPADAPGEVKKETDLVTKAAGGKGVFRELVELVLKTQGTWDQACERYYEKGD